jgi:RsiW-degrading membrane proteinase PrsW (M82 family)
MNLHPTIIIAILIATIVPLVFLYVMRTLDLYGTGAFRTVLACFVAGLAAFGVALLINQTMLDNNIVTEDFFRQFSAPVIEEILKSVFLLYLVRRANFTYFVDGAIYGFACGIGFAILENYYYVYFHTDAALGVAVARVLSTNLMHASASALVGIALGLSRFQKFPTSLLALLSGYALAMGLHIGYNNLVTRVSGGFLLLYAALVGFGAAGVIAVAIRRGLAEEKQWIRETLGEADRVTLGETAIVNRLSESQKILASLAQKFGANKAEQIERFLMLQAQLGIKRKTLEKLADDRIKRDVETDMDRIRVQMNDLRRSVGVYTMSYVRSIFPEEGTLAFSVLGDRITEQAMQPSSGKVSVFDRTTERLNQIMPADISKERDDLNG